MISSLDIRANRESLTETLRTHGYVALRGHDIDKTAIRNFQQLAENFFALPLSTKAQYFDPNNGALAGYLRIPGGDDHYSSDVCEFWNVLCPTQLSDKSYLRPQNPWPSEINHFKETSLALYSQADALVHELLGHVSATLTSDANYLPGLIDDSWTALRMMHYPPASAEVAAEKLRGQEHTDITMLTLFLGGTDEGLEILDADGHWQPANLAEGEVLIACGEMLERLSNGLFRAVPHRVVQSPESVKKQRFSFTLFVAPRPEVSLAPLAQAIEQNGPDAKYEDISSGQYLAQRIGLGVVELVAGLRAALDQEIAHSETHLAANTAN